MQTAQRIYLVEPLTAVGLFEMVNFIRVISFLSRLCMCVCVCPSRHIVNTGRLKLPIKSVILEDPAYIRGIHRC